MARETDIEDAVCAWAENNGWLSRKMVYAGRRGCPPWFFFGHGRVVPMDFRRAGPDSVQHREYTRLKVAGTPVHVVHDSETGIALLR